VTLLKSLHFMMLEYHLGKHPGQWRPGSVSIENQDGGRFTRLRSATR
jgi:hypothetical protein